MTVNGFKFKNYFKANFTFGYEKTAPKVTIDKDIINFDLCLIGNQVAQTFRIINNSSISLPYNVYLFNFRYLKRLNRSPSIFHTSTSFMYEVHAWKKDGLIFKRLRYFLEAINFLIKIF